MKPNTDIPIPATNLDPDILRQLLDPATTAADIAEMTGFDPNRLQKLAESEDLHQCIDALAEIERARYDLAASAARSIALQLLLRIAIENVSDSPETARKAADSILTAKTPERKPDKNPKPDPTPPKRPDTDQQNQLRQWALRQLHTAHSEHEINADLESVSINSTSKHDCASPKDNHQQRIRPPPSPAQAKPSGRGPG